MIVFCRKSGESCRRRFVGYYTRVLSKDEVFPTVDELVHLIGDKHPSYKLSIEDGSEQDWEILLLSGSDEVEVALVERNPVTPGSLGQGEIAEFIEEIQDCKPQTGVEWLQDYLAIGKNDLCIPAPARIRHRGGRQRSPCIALSPLGDAATQSFKPISKDSPTKTGTTSCGSFRTLSQALEHGSDTGRNLASLHDGPWRP